MVVDDQKGIIALMKALFEPMGFEVLVAGDGVTGLDLAREYLPDIVLMDWVLPRLAGSHVLAALKAEAATAHVPVIFLTALVSEIPAAVIAEDGVSYLGKPFDLDVLITLVKDKAGRGRSLAI